MMWISVQDEHGRMRLINMSLVREVKLVENVIVFRNGEEGEDSQGWEYSTHTKISFKTKEEAESIFNRLSERLNAYVI